VAKVPRYRSGLAHIGGGSRAPLTDMLHADPSLAPIIKRRIMKIAAASAVGCSTRLDQHAGCACVRHPIAVRCSAAMAHCDSGLATGQIPLALRGRLRWRPKVVHPPAVERACILRVLVGAQAAPVLACTLARRALSSIIVRCSKSVPLPRHVAAPAAGVSRCANLGDSTSAPDSVASNTLCPSSRPAGL
jgi:hypothetical protein